MPDDNTNTNPAHRAAEKLETRAAEFCNQAREEIEFLMRKLQGMLDDLERGRIPHQGLDLNRLTTMLAQARELKDASMLVKSYGDFED